MQLAGKGACLTPHHDTLPYPACPLPPLPCRYLELPVSTTHSIVGAVIGMSMVAAGAGSGGWCGRLGGSCSWSENWVAAWRCHLTPPAAAALSLLPATPNQLPVVAVVPSEWCHYSCSTRVLPPATLSYTPRPPNCDSSLPPACSALPAAPACCPAARSGVVQEEGWLPLPGWGLSHCE
jgi:hypothetical protein